MARRFPSPIVGVPQSPTRYEQVASIVADEESQSLSWDEFVDSCRDRLRKPETNERYSPSYLRRSLSTYELLGVFDREDGRVTLPDPTEQWLSGELEFDDFLWYALRRSWVLQNEFPRGIEGLGEVHDAVIALREEHDDDVAVTRERIREWLAAERAFEFNENGIRGYPLLLTQLGAVTRDGDSYAPGPRSGTYKDRIQNSDLFRAFERRLRREGAHVEPPTDRVKRDLMKYYMYRECGGLGKERRWYQTFWKDYLNESARSGEVTQAQFGKSEQSDRYRSVVDERSELFETVREMYDSLDSADLRGLSTDVLRRMRDAESCDDAWRIKIASGSGISRLDLAKLTTDDRSEYTFAEDFELYDWQSEAVSEWFANVPDAGDAERGIVQVVTGAGKTVMALDVLRQWLDDHPDGVVTVLVPTKVLMSQWLTELTATLNVPVKDVGWAGGGHKDSFSDGCRVLVSIVNSAVQDDYLGEELAAAGDPPHLLIADECHRYTGDVFSNVFDYHRSASLGLSATPLSETVSEPGDKSHLERSDEIELTDDDTLLLNELGPIYYTLTYDEGLSRGLIPEFSINYVGFELTTAERQTYDTLTRKISNTLSDIRSRHGHRLDSMGGGFNQNLQVLLQRDDVSTPEIADFFEYTSERRELVADAAARQGITLELLRTVLEDEQKAIVFQERIEQLERMVAPFETLEGDGVRDSRKGLYELYPKLKEVDKELEDLFSRADYKPVMYHSGHTKSVWNDFAMEWFREEGFANVMLSVKALIEGVDVPSADIGIIRVSGSSVRQRIQTLGRVLRTGEDPDKHSEMYVLYARDTVDEKIFSKHDWTNELANAEVNHYIWETRDTALDGELRPATESEIPRGRSYEEPEVPDPETLDRGDPYSGPVDGYRISVDASGRPFDPGQNSRRYITTPEVTDAASFVHREKGGGNLTITDAGHMVTRLPEEGPVFVGVLEGGIEALEYGEDTGTVSENAPTSLDEL